MTLAEELRNKYALTSFKTKSMSMPLLAINETLEAAAKIADQEHSPIVASRIRSLKWVDRSMALISVPQGVSLTKPSLVNISSAVADLNPEIALDLNCRNKSATLRYRQLISPV